VKTVPDFEGAWIDSEITFELRKKEKKEDRSVSDEKVEQGPAETLDSWIDKDPTYRISKLEAANQKVVSISPDGTIAQAITIMMTHDFTQLPVMTSERDVKGILNWRSIGSRMALGATADLVRNLMESHNEISHDASIFSAISTIVAKDYVLIRGSDNKINGIVTVSDLAIQFQTLTEPFLLLSEIENLIRNLLESNFTKEELASARDPAAGGRVIDSVADMTFGEYIRLLQSPEKWKQIKLSIDRDIFCKDLDRVREIRNGVTHFDPDGISEEELGFLREFANFLKELQKISNRKKS